MLTFTIYYLLKNPGALRRLREEIDSELKGRPMTVRHVNKLPYLLGEHWNSKSIYHPVSDMYQR